MSILSQLDIQRIVYANERQNLLDVMYRDENTLKSYYVRISEDFSPDLNYIIDQGYTFESIYTETVEWNKKLSDGFQQMIQHHAASQFDEMHLKHEIELDKVRRDAFSDGRSLLFSLIENNKNARTVKEAKIAAFSLPAIVNSEDQIKLEIRDATTVAEIAAIVERI